MYGFANGSLKFVKLCQQVQGVTGSTIGNLSTSLKFYRLDHREFVNRSFFIDPFTGLFIGKWLKKENRCRFESP